jgi:hypothetical protein
MVGSQGDPQGRWLARHKQRASLSIVTTKKANKQCYGIDLRRGYRTIDVGPDRGRQGEQLPKTFFPRQLPVLFDNLRFTTWLITEQRAKPPVRGKGEPPHCSEKQGTTVTVRVSPWAAWWKWLFPVPWKVLLWSGPCPIADSSFLPSNPLTVGDSGWFLVFRSHPVPRPQDEPINPDAPGSGTRKRVRHKDRGGHSRELFLSYSCSVSRAVRKLLFPLNMN